MKKSYDYALEKFRDAVTSLITSTESLQERLLSVFLYNILPMHEDQIPPKNACGNQQNYRGSLSQR